MTPNSPFKAEGKNLGNELFEIISDLYPFCRSITGNGLRATLSYLQRIVPLTLHEVPSGAQVLDWVVPNEWNIQDAYIKDSRGVRIVDFQKSNLHVLNYSVPVRQTMRLETLKPHLFTLPEHPDWVPYRTSYYTENWGFCLTHNQLRQLQDDAFEVCINSTLEPGHLTYGEFIVPGQSRNEVLISCHSCHPSLANDNLAGVSIAVGLAKHLASQRLRYTYRFLWIPGTIGSITWLARNELAATRIKHGLVLSCLGDSGHMTFKQTRRGNAEIDRAATHVLKHSTRPFEIIEFSPWGYDERQYCSPGFNLPVGCLMRTPNGRYPEYHSSADNLDFVKPDALADSFCQLLSILEVLEKNAIYTNLMPKGEPQLGRRGLYTTGEDSLPLLWVLNQSDGTHSLLDIAERAALPFSTIAAAARSLCGVGLLAESPREIHSPAV